MNVQTQTARPSSTIRLRLYLPTELESEAQLPLIFASYPGHVDGWESVSVALAAQGYALVAHSPLAQWEIDVDQHAFDGRIALVLARSGALSPQVGTGPAVALAGSFSSSILYRMLRVPDHEIAAWVTVGGIGNAFSSAADFYAGNISLPQRYALVIPALGAPHIYPESFLRYSPVYSAQELPPTLIIHTGADRIIPIEQAYELEHALQVAGVQVETFYYDDVSHYLQIDANMTDAGQEMFYRILDFIERNLVEKDRT